MAIRRRGGLNHSKLDQVVANARRDKEEREKGYRERALKIYPWVCGRCTREFNQQSLHELTVHLGGDAGGNDDRLLADTRHCCQSCLMRRKV